MIEYVVFLGQMDLNDHKIQNVGSLLYLYSKSSETVSEKNVGVLFTPKEVFGNTSYHFGTNH